MGKSYYPTVKRIEKLSKEEQLDIFFDLINAFRIVKSPTDTTLFIQDLLTASEIKNLAKRLRIAKLLLRDEYQRDIAHKLHCSIATVTKVNYWLNQGGEGFKKVIKKLPNKYSIPENLPHGPIEFHLPQTLLALTQYSIAKNQTKKIEKFSENIEKKRNLDKNLREMFSEEYRTRKKKRE